MPVLEIVMRWMWRRRKVETLHSPTVLNGERKLCILEAQNLNQQYASPLYHADFLLAGCCDGWVSSFSSSPPSASLPCQTQLRSMVHAIVR